MTPLFADIINKFFPEEKKAQKASKIDVVTNEERTPVMKIRQITLKLSSTTGGFYDDHDEELWQIAASKIIKMRYQLILHI